MEYKDGVPHLDVSIEDIKEQVGLIVDAIRPDWNKEDVKIEDRSSGYINRNYHCYTPGGEAFFVRVVNTRIPGQLETATNAMRYLRHLKLGAQLLLTFNNGLVMEFIEGEVVTWHDIAKVKEPTVWLSYAREMAKYHSKTDFELAKQYKILGHKEILAKFRGMVGGGLAKGNIPEEDLKKLPTLDQIMEWSEVPYQQLIEAGAETVFSRADSNPTNIIIRPDKTIALIDYDDCVLEFACCEMSGAFGSLAGLLDFNMANMPTDEQQDAFIREYLKTRHEFDPSRGLVTEKKVQYWKFLLRKAQLRGVVLAIGIMMMLQDVATRSIDFSLCHQFLKIYEESKDQVLAEKFSWDD